MNDALHAWLVESERENNIKKWREAHPGQPLPDDYREIRRWAIEQWNATKAMALLAYGDETIQ
jgi:hypothetical protein